MYTTAADETGSGTPYPVLPVTVTVGATTHPLTYGVSCNLFELKRMNQKKLVTF